MNHTEATQYIKATLAAFCPGEAISMTQDTWAKLHEAMSALIDQPEQRQEPTAWTATRLWNRKDTWTCPADIEKDLLDGRVIPAQQQEPVAWCPDVCPITGLPFFMWIEHYETGQRVPTYGGPYDSYTIPVRVEDGSYCRERYDHDRGGWLTDEVEDVGVQIVSDQAYVSDEPPASKPLPEDYTALEQALTRLQKRYADLEGRASKPLTDASGYLHDLVTALDGAFISTWQSTAAWQKQLDAARDYLAAHGIKGDA